MPRGWFLAGSTPAGYDAGTDDNTPFLVMELAAGGSLRDRIKAGPLPIETVREAGIQIARALAAAHAANILHRDVKPANILAASDVWKLADFQSNSALVVGSGTKDWQKVDYAAQACEFTIGDRVAKATGAHPFGNPFRLLPWLVKHVAQRGLGLRAGDIITTGAWTGLETAQAGDTVVARFPGIGEATLKIG